MAITIEQKKKLKDIKIKMEAENLDKKNKTHLKCVIGEICLKYAKVKEPSEEFIKKLEEYLAFNEKKGNWFSSWFKSKK